MGTSNDKPMVVAWWHKTHVRTCFYRGSGTLLPSLLSLLYGLPFPHPSQNDCTALHLAAHENSKDVAELVLGHKDFTEVNAKTKVESAMLIG